MSTIQFNRIGRRDPKPTAELPNERVDGTFRQLPKSPYTLPRNVTLSCSPESNADVKFELVSRFVHYSPIAKQKTCTFVYLIGNDPPK